MVWDVKIKLKKIKVKKKKKNWFTNPKTVHQYILVPKYSVPVINPEWYSKLCGEMPRCVLDVWDLLGNARDCCLQLYYLVGEIGLGCMAQRFWTWCWLVWCGLYWRSGIVVCLRILGVTWINWNTCSFALFF